MAINLPSFQRFDMHVDPMSLGYKWKSWTGEFDNLMVALGVTNAPRKKALLLYYAGHDVHELYKTLFTDGDAADDYATAVKRLTEYFEPKKNRTYEIYHFRKMFQDEPSAEKSGERETIDEFVTRLKKTATRCEFSDVQLEIKLQVIFGCTSKRVRRKALSEDLTLDELLKFARVIESSSKQAELIEEEKSGDTVNQLRRPGKYSKLHQSKGTASTSNQKNTCFSCGGVFPHPGGRRMCPAYGKTCNRCKKTNHFEKVCRSEKTINEGNQINKLCTGKSEKRDHEQNCLVDDESELSSGDEYVNMNFVKDGISANIWLLISGKRIKFQIDTGASVNIISEDDYNKIREYVTVCKTSRKIFAYGAKSPLALVGKFTTTVESKKKIDVLTFYIAKRTSRFMGSLIGLHSAVSLNLISIVNNLDSGASTPKCDNTVIRKLIHEFSPSVFCDKVGKMKDVLIDINVDDSVKPVAVKHRRVPFHLRDRVGKEIERLLKADIIENVDEPTDWVSPIVISNKPNGDLRLCVDMTEPNKCIKRIHHVIPTVDDIKYQVNGACYFSKIDLMKGYHQLELAPKSRNLTTFSTHMGLARYKRLNFGCKSASEIFHEAIRKKLIGVNGALNIHDDILIFGKTKYEHNLALREVLEVLKANGLTANSKKCEFLKSNIKFYGLMFSDKGIAPDPDKIMALRNAVPPTNKRELKSFLGMTNFSAKFIKDYADRTAILRDLTKEYTKWSWDEDHERAFRDLTGCLEESCLLRYFDPVLETQVICDASPFGLCATLVQVKNGVPRVIEYASRALTETEKKYGQIEREALSILFGCLKYQIYLLGNKFTVITDHLPLLACFNNPKSQMPYRIERIRMKLMGFDFVVKHCPGKDNVSDFLSRKSLKIRKVSREEKDIEYYIHALITDTDDCISIDDIRNAINNDYSMKLLRDIIINGGFIKETDVLLRDYKKIFKELYVVDKLIMRGDKIIIPDVLRAKIIRSGHDGHQGIVKTKQLLRSKYWWPAMDDAIKTFITNCRGCQVSVLKNEKEPLIMTPLPEGPWENLVADFHGPLRTGEYLLIIIDEYSRFPVVEIVNSTSYKTTVQKFDRIFAEFGIPKKLKSDNGPPFNGFDFRKFAKFLGFKHQRITPYYPEANGLVEKFNTGLEKVLHTSQIEQKDWRHELNAYLRNYRATPHSTTNESPANLLFQKRNFRTRLPERSLKIDDDELRYTDETRKAAIKYYADRKRTVKFSNIEIGDTVLLKIKRKRKSDPYYDPKPYLITGRKGNMLSASRGSRIVVRNSSFFKKIPISIVGDDTELDDDIIVDDEDDSEVECMAEIEEIPVLRRSTRVTGQPVRYPMDMAP